MTTIPDLYNGGNMEYHSTHQKFNLFYEKPEYKESLLIGGKHGLRINITKKHRWLTKKLLLWLLEIEVLPPVK